MKKTNLAMVVFSSYPFDARVRREAESLKDAGMDIDIFCVQNEGQIRQENIRGIQVNRVKIDRRRAGKFRYVREYMYFLFWAFFKVARNHLHKKYDLIHVHNMPDILVLSAFFPKLTGARVILDMHDPMPEVFITKFSLDANHYLIRILKILEKYSIRFADAVLTPNKAFKSLFVERGAPEEKIHLLMNSPQESIFKPQMAFNRDYLQGNANPFKVMYHGSILERHGLDIAVAAIQKVQEKIPNIEFHVFGFGEFTEIFLQKVEELNLQDVVKYYGLVPLEKIAAFIRTVHVGIIPNRFSVFTNLNFPTRIFEYLCLHKPVIVPRTKGIQDYFDEDSINYFDPGNFDDLVNVILDVYQNPEEQKKIVAKGNIIYQKYRWLEQQKYLTNLVKTLV